MPDDTMDQVASHQTMLEGFCTCLTKHGQTYRMADCGLSSHRVAARGQRDRRI